MTAAGKRIPIKYEAQAPKFIQIAAADRILYALDEDGVVWAKLHAGRWYRVDSEKCD